MTDTESRPVLLALDEELDMEETRPLQEVVDVDAVRRLRAHGGSFELTFSAYEREVTVTEDSVDISG